MTEYITSRPEAEVFQSLRALCSKPGFVHALAHICWRDKTVPYMGAVTPETLLPTYSHERLIRTETAVLIGLLVQQSIAVDRVDAQTLKTYIAEADRLSEEMHGVLKAPMIAGWRADPAAPVGCQQPTEGEFLREAIFYASESAYFFQFLDFAPLRYAQDSDWLARNKGFTMREAAAVVEAISAVLHEQLAEATHRYIAAQDPAEILLAFMVRPSAIAERSGLGEPLVDQVFKAFSLATRNENFRAIDDYNETSAFPLIPLGSGDYFVFDTVALDQSLYESPIFWMRADDAYKDQAVQHRGAFTEAFACERLRRVFGAEHVHPNVRLTQGKDTIDEIDVLVTYGDRLIVVQAKSKGLTIEARKGNNLSIRKDFQAAVAGAYEQALSAAKHLEALDATFVLADRAPLQLRAPIKEIFLFCVIADHYPSLSNQTRSLLKAQTKM